ncbi:ABC transporter ATP-binding protein [Paenibacillus sp. YYML68]|uniref:ABC transporter ATP-binding protein n=1 Tax=Paenibacillus sp. YYML68 TaxID=2909250 RepID=UPI002492A008
MKVTQLTKTYETESGKVHILKGISCSFRRGELVSIMGPSGSGKSTLLGILGTLDVPTSGRVIIDGRDITDLSEHQLVECRAKKVGFVFQAYNLISTMTALENVMLPMRFGEQSVGRKSMEQRARELLEIVGIGNKTSNLPTQLSGGQQQRVAIARALANRPPIVVMDEPTGNLDSQTGRRIIDLILELREKYEMTFVLATHDPLISKLSDRTIHILDGQVSREEPREEVVMS